MNSQEQWAKEIRFLRFYEHYRRGAQSKWYRGRCETYERAHRQSVSLTSFVLFLSSLTSLMATAWPKPRIVGDLYLAWPVVATVLAATGTAIAAYRSLYGFQENARLYRDADVALASAFADSPDECRNCAEAKVEDVKGYIPKVEEVFRLEQGQWGQLAAQVRQPTPPDPKNRNGGGGGGDGNGNGGGNGGGGKNPPAVQTPPAGQTLTADQIPPAGETPSAGETRPAGEDPAGEEGPAVDDTPHPGAETPQPGEGPAAGAEEEPPPTEPDPNAASG